MWPFGAAGVLAAGNLASLWHIRALRLRNRTSGIVANLWAQITMDLVILTVAVHYVGSMTTPVPFMYLFHIVLACIFFSTRQSLAVTSIAVTLYVLNITAEYAGTGYGGMAFADVTWLRLTAPTAGAFLFSMLSTVGIWLVVWYLASHLATMVRESDAELAETNRRLIAAQAERSRHMLTTTHQLKAPFAAIHANAQLLLDGYCGPLTDDARQVVARIAARCRRLAAEIQEMLQLANLDSSSQQPLPWVDIDVAEVLKWCVSQIEPTAQARRITVDQSIESAHVRGVEDHLRMLFTNLLSNGVAYSHSGATVRLRCERGRDQEAIVTIADDGIGIAADKLPRIFDEHYRTNEAVAHNKESSGLGLAIVRRVVELHRIRLRVVSRPSAGTLFELRFAPPGAALDARHEEEEEERGLPANG
jgi:signal transduction histidine kinase